MISSQKNSARLGLCIFATLACLILPVSAQEIVHKDMMPALSTSTTAKEYNVAPGEETHPPIRLSADKTEMVRLDEDANSVIIGNPAHLNVMLDNSRLLLLAAREPGATQFTVLNRAGKIIMQRHVIVSGPQEKYIRVRRSCINGRSGCQPTTVYYCPGVCHDVRVLAGQNTMDAQSASVPSAGGPAPSTNIDGMADNADSMPVEDNAVEEDTSSDYDLSE